MLDVQGLTRTFGGLVAVNEVSLRIPAGALIGVIGPNGSGKTTLFNLLTGFLRPTAGSIRFGGEEIADVAPHLLVRRGIARTFQVVRFHKDSTVRETVWAAQAVHLGLQAWMRGPGSRNAEQTRLREEVDRILELTWLKDHADRLARELPFGLVRQLEIARALATRPKLLLMDEPASGMNPSETDRLISDIRRLSRQGLTICIIEHDMDVVMELSERIVVLNFGKKICEGTPDEVRRDPEVVRAYLGGGKRRADA